MVTNQCEWKLYPKNMNNKLHTLCSYMAMFPPSLPHHFIKKYSNEGDTVCDPFSGRGTTIAEACFMGRKCIGNDMNPLAYLLTKAKSNVPQKGRIVSRLNFLENQSKNFKTDVYSEPSQIQMIFNELTLKQLMFLKEKLNWKYSNVDNFIAAMVMGIIHGNSEGYCSVSMPNTFSMSPNYVKNYIKEHNLKKPERDVFTILKKKLDKCYQRPKTIGKAYNRDVRRMKRIKDNSIDLIITSPPYTRVIRYGQFNWIRLWFLGETGKSVDSKLFFSQSNAKYYVFMQEALKEMQRILRNGAKSVLVIGDVKDRETDTIYDLASLVWENCAKPLGFKLVEPIIADVIKDENKVSKIWGAKKGNATKIDRILILEK